MAVYLLTEIYKKKEDPTYKSVHDEYVNVLPGDMNDFPVCYPDETMALLEGSEVKELIEKRARWYKEDYDYIAKYVPDMKQFDYNDYLYCCLMSNSRAFDLPIDGVITRCMLPYADMLDHKNPKETDWYYD